jgi:hypothetical protein
MPAVKRLVALALAGAFALGGCGVPTDSGPRDIDNPRAHSSDGPLAADAGSQFVRIYLVRDGRLVRVLHRVPAAQSAQGQLQQLLKGPSAAESRNGMTTALSTTNIISLTVVNRRATVEIGTPPAPGARSDEVLAYGQIVCTLTSQGAEVGTVSFLSDGKPLAVPSADGSLTDAPLTIADYAGLLDS